MLGHTEIIIIVLVIVLLFGAAAIPKLAKAIGKAKAEFTKGVEEGQKPDDEESQKIETKPAKKG